jgi:phenylalanyl-tRNA synthetase beta chain
VLNPIASHLGVMRTTLLPGLLEVLGTNVNRKAPRVRIFELGRVFRGGAADAQPVRLVRSRLGTRAPRAMGREAGARSTTSTSRAMSKRWPLR